MVDCDSGQGGRVFETAGEVSFIHEFRKPEDAGMDRKTTFLEGTVYPLIYGGDMRILLIEDEKKNCPFHPTWNEGRRVFR